MLDNNMDFSLSLMPEQSERFLHERQPLVCIVSVLVVGELNVAFSKEIICTVSVVLVEANVENVGVLDMVECKFLVPSRSDSLFPDGSGLVRLNGGSSLQVQLCVGFVQACNIFFSQVASFNNSN